MFVLRKVKSINAQNLEHLTNYGQSTLVYPYWFVFHVNRLCFPLRLELFLYYVYIYSPSSQWINIYRNLSSYSLSSNIIRKNQVLPWMYTNKISVSYKRSLPHMDQLQRTRRCSFSSDPPILPLLHLFLKLQHLQQTPKRKETHENENE